MGTFKSIRRGFHLLENLREERRLSQPLTHLCRAKIFQQLGYNPQGKVEELSLPKTLKEFVKFKDVELM